MGFLTHMLTKGRTRALGQRLIQGGFSGEIYLDRNMDMIYVAAMVQDIVEVDAYAHLHSVQYFAFKNIKKRIKFKHLPLHCYKCGLFSQLKSINLMHYLERCKHFFLGLVQALKSDKIIYTYETQQAEVFY